MKWEPVDIIVLILVIVTGALLLFGEAKSLIPAGKGADVETIKFISHAIGAYIAIISLYVGSIIGKNNENDQS